MSFINRRQFLATSLAATGAVSTGLLHPLGMGGEALAKPQIPGIEARAPGLTTGEERTAQPDIWTLEVLYKPVRMIEVSVPDKTGKPVKQLLWYLVYRVINREDTLAPAADVKRPLFVPELTLLTDDNGVQKRYYDRVIPIAQAAINKRERHKSLNSVEIVQELPPPVKLNVVDAPTLDGVAIWRGVDPHTDFFKVFFSGFSNGYRVTTVEDKEVVQRKTLVQEFERPSDALQQSEEEIKLVGEAQWVYR